MLMTVSVEVPGAPGMYWTEILNLTRLLEKQHAAAAAHPLAGPPSSAVDVSVAMAEMYLTSKLRIARHLRRDELDSYKLFLREVIPTHATASMGSSEGGGFYGGSYFFGTQTLALDSVAKLFSCVAAHTRRYGSRGATFRVMFAKPLGQLPPSPSQLGAEAEAALVGVARGSHAVCLADLVQRPVNPTLSASALLRAVLEREQAKGRMCGFLDVLQPRAEQWVERWVVLTADTLVIFQATDAKGGEATRRDATCMLRPLESIPLTASSVHVSAIGLREWQVYAGTQAYTFRCGGQSEMLSWVSAATWRHVTMNDNMFLPAADAACAADAAVRTSRDLRIVEWVSSLRNILHLSVLRDKVQHFARTVGAEQLVLFWIHCRAYELAHPLTPLIAPFLSAQEPFATGASSTSTSSSTGGVGCDETSGEPQLLLRSVLFSKYCDYCDREDAQAVTFHALTIYARFLHGAPLLHGEWSGESVQAVRKELCSAVLSQRKNAQAAGAGVNVGSEEGGAGCTNTDFTLPSPQLFYSLRCLVEATLHFSVFQQYAALFARLVTPSRVHRGAEGGGGNPPKDKRDEPPADTRAAKARSRSSTARRPSGLPPSAASRTSRSQLSPPRSGSVTQRRTSHAIGATAQAQMNVVFGSDAPQPPPATSATDGGGSTFGSRQPVASSSNSGAGAAGTGWRSARPPTTRRDSSQSLGGQGRRESSTTRFGGDATAVHLVSLPPPTATTYDVAVFAHSLTAEGGESAPQRGYGGSFSDYGRPVSPESLTTQPLSSESKLRSRSMSIIQMLQDARGQSASPPTGGLSMSMSTMAGARPYRTSASEATPSHSVRNMRTGSWTSVFSVATAASSMGGSHTRTKSPPSHLQQQQPQVGSVPLDAPSVVKQLEELDLPVTTMLQLIAPALVNAWRHKWDAVRGLKRRFSAVTAIALHGSTEEATTRGRSGHLVPTCTRTKGTVLSLPANDVFSPEEMKLVNEDVFRAASEGRCLVEDEDEAVWEGASTERDGESVGSHGGGGSAGACLPSPFTYAAGVDVDNHVLVQLMHKYKVPAKEVAPFMEVGVEEHVRTPHTPEGGEREAHGMHRKASVMRTTSIFIPNSEMGGRGDSISSADTSVLRTVSGRIAEEDVDGAHDTASESGASHSHTGHTPSRDMKRGDARHPLGTGHDIHRFRRQVREAIPSSLWASIWNPRPGALFDATADILFESSERGGPRPLAKVHEGSGFASELSSRDAVTRLQDAAAQALLISVELAALKRVECEASCALAKAATQDTLQALTHTVAVRCAAAAVEAAQLWHTGARDMAGARVDAESRRRQLLRAFRSRVAALADSSHKHVPLPAQVARHVPERVVVLPPVPSPLHSTGAVLVPAISMSLHPQLDDDSFLTVARNTVLSSIIETVPSSATAATTAVDAANTAAVPAPSPDARPRSIPRPPSPDARPRSIPRPPARIVAKASDVMARGGSMSGEIKPSDLLVRGGSMSGEVKAAEVMSRVGSMGGEARQVTAPEPPFLRASSGDTCDSVPAAAAATGRLDAPLSDAAFASIFGVPRLAPWRAVIDTSATRDSPAGTSPSRGATAASITAAAAVSGGAWETVLDSMDDAELACVRSERFHRSTMQWAALELSDMLLSESEMPALQHREGTGASTLHPFSPKASSRSAVRPSIRSAPGKAASPGGRPPSLSPGLFATVDDGYFPLVHATLHAHTPPTKLRGLDASGVAESKTEGESLRLLRRAITLPPHELNKLMRSPTNSGGKLIPPMRVTTGMHAFASAAAVAATRRAAALYRPLVGLAYVVPLKIRSNTLFAYSEGGDVAFEFTPGASGVGSGGGGVTAGATGTSESTAVTTRQPTGSAPPPPRRESGPSAPKERDTISATAPPEDRRNRVKRMSKIGDVATAASTSGPSFGSPFAAPYGAPPVFNIRLDGLPLMPLQVVYQGWLRVAWCDAIPNVPLFDFPIVSKLYNYGGGNKRVVFTQFTERRGVVPGVSGAGTGGGKPLMPRECRLDIDYDAAFRKMVDEVRRANAMVTNPPVPAAERSARGSSRRKSMADELYFGKSYESMTPTAARKSSGFWGRSTTPVTPSSGGSGGGGEGGGSGGGVASTAARSRRLTGVGRGLADSFDGDGSMQRRGSEYPTSARDSSPHPARRVSVHSPTEAVDQAASEGAAVTRGWHKLYAVLYSDGTLAFATSEVACDGMSAARYCSTYFNPVQRSALMSPFVGGVSLPSLIDIAPTRDPDAPSHALELVSRVGYLLLIPEVSSHSPLWLRRLRRTVLSPDATLVSVDEEGQKFVGGIASIAVDAPSPTAAGASGTNGTRGGGAFKTPLDTVVEAFHRPVVTDAGGSQVRTVAIKDASLLKKGRFGGGWQVRKLRVVLSHVNKKSGREGGIGATAASLIAGAVGAAVAAPKAIRRKSFFQNERTRSADTMRAATLSDIAAQSTGDIHRAVRAWAGLMAGQLAPGYTDAMLGGAASGHVTALRSLVTAGHSMELVPAIAALCGDSLPFCVRVLLKARNGEPGRMATGMLDDALDDISASQLAAFDASAFYYRKTGGGAADTLRGTIPLVHCGHARLLGVRARFVTIPAPTPTASQPYTGAADTRMAVGAVASPPSAATRIASGLRRILGLASGSSPSRGEVGEGVGVHLVPRCEFEVDTPDRVWDFATEDVLSTVEWLMLLRIFLPPRVEQLRKKFGEIAASKPYVSLSAAADTKASKHHVGDIETGEEVFPVPAAWLSLMVGIRTSFSLLRRGSASSNTIITGSPTTPLASQTART